MRRALVVVLAIGCSKSKPAAVADAAHDPVACKRTLESEIDRTCTVPTDCVLVQSADCCGPIDLAVKQGTEATFPDAEAMYEACLACPPLGCAHQLQAEDGTTPQAGQMIVATCISGRCQSIVQ